MKARGLRPRPGLLIRRIFQPDPDRAAAALADLLGIQPGEPASEPAGDGSTSRSLGVQREDRVRSPRASASRARSRRRDRHPEPPATPGRAPRAHGRSVGEPPGAGPAEPRPSGPWTGRGGMSTAGRVQGCARFARRQRVRNHIPTSEQEIVPSALGALPDGGASRGALLGPSVDHSALDRPRAPAGLPPGREADRRATLRPGQAGHPAPSAAGPRTTYGST